jgi:hypothetical protein
MEQVNIPSNLLLLESSTFDGLRVKMHSLDCIYEEVQFFRTAQGYEVILRLDRPYKFVKNKDLVKIDSPDDLTTTITEFDNVKK